VTLHLVSANPAAPTVDQPFRALGRVWTLTLGVKGLFDIEREMGVTLRGMSGLLMNLTLPSLCQLIVIGLRKHHADSANEATALEIIGDIGIVECARPISNSMIASMALLMPNKGIKSL